MAETEDRGVAIFDLDKTLTIRSSYTPFILFAARRNPARFLYAPGLLGMAVLMLLGIVGRDDVKAAMWRAVIGGMERDKAEALGAQFAKHWARTALRPGTRDALAEHKDAGARLVLASAAVDIVAEPFARLLRFDDVVATRTEWDVSGKATGGFVGLNCYGDEKLVRVKTLLGESAPPRSAAYSDHVTDVPLLTWAHTGYAVNPHRPLAEVAAAHGLIVLDLDAPPNKADAV